MEQSARDPLPTAQLTTPLSPAIFVFLSSLLQCFYNVSFSLLNLKVICVHYGKQKKKKNKFTCNHKIRAQNPGTHFLCA